MGWAEEAEKTFTHRANNKAAKATKKALQAERLNGPCLTECSTCRNGNHWKDLCSLKDDPVAAQASRDAVKAKLRQEKRKAKIAEKEELKAKASADAPRTSLKGVAESGPVATKKRKTVPKTELSKSKKEEAIRKADVSNLLSSDNMAFVRMPKTDIPLQTVARALVKGSIKLSSMNPMGSDFLLFFSSASEAHAALEKEFQVKDESDQKFVLKLTQYLQGSARSLTQSAKRLLQPLSCM